MLFPGLSCLYLIFIYLEVRKIGYIVHYCEPKSKRKRKIWAKYLNGVKPVFIKTASIEEPYILLDLSHHSSTIV